MWEQIFVMEKKGKMYRIMRSKSAISRTIGIGLGLIVVLAVISGAYFLTLPSTTPTDAFKVALILPGTIDDVAWNQAAYEGMMNAKKELAKEGIEVEVGYSELVDYVSDEGIMRDYAGAGFDLIVPHSFGYRDSGLLVSDESGIALAVSQGNAEDIVPGRVSTYDSFGEETSFLLGILAAGMTKSNKVGALQGMESPDCVRNREGFAAGVEYANPDIAILKSVIGSWEDPVKGKESANALIAAGADIIYDQGDGTSFGVEEAIRENPGVIKIGYPFDKALISEDIALSSIVYDWGPVFEDMIRDLINEDFGKAYSIDMDNGITMAPYHGFDAQVPQSLRDDIADAHDAIVAGDIEVQ